MKLFLAFISTILVISIKSQTITLASYTNGSGIYVTLTNLPCNNTISSYYMDVVNEDYSYSNCFNSCSPVDFQISGNNRYTYLNINLGCNKRLKISGYCNGNQWVAYTNVINNVDVDVPTASEIPEFICSGTPIYFNNWSMPTDQYWYAIQNSSVTGETLFQSGSTYQQSGEIDDVLNTNLASTTVTYKIQKQCPFATNQWVQNEININVRTSNLSIIDNKYLIGTTQYNNDSTFCEGESISFINPTFENQTIKRYFWGNGLDSTYIIQGVNYTTIANSGSFFYSKTNGCSTVYSDTISISFIPLTIVEDLLTVDPPLCAYETLDININEIYNVPFTYDYWEVYSQTPNISGLNQVGTMYNDTIIHDSITFYGADIYGVTTYKITNINFEGSCLNTYNLAHKFIIVDGNKWPKGNIYSESSSNLCIGHSAILQVSGFSPVPPILWSTGETNDSITVSSPGTYTYTAFRDGCSIPSNPFTLTSSEPTTGSETQILCNSYSWNGNTYSSSGTYTANLVNSNGCDSLATLNLTILESSTGSETVANCENYTWHGTTYTNSGTYSTTLTNSNGCDSIVTLNLTINPLPSVNLPNLGSYCDTLNSFALTGGTPVGGQYSGTSVTNNNFDPTIGEGNYTVTYTYSDANGCSNSDNGNLTVIECVNTASLYENTISLFKIFPNPTNSKLTIIVQETNSPHKVKVLNLSGQTLDQIEFDSNAFTLDFSSFAKGIYFVDVDGHKEKVVFE